MHQKRKGWHPFWTALGAALLVLLPLVGTTVLLSRQQLRSQLEQTRNSLNLQVAQAVREIEAMRESQRKASTNQPGHGLGVRSICAIVEQYGGIYSFARQQDQFVLRISL